MTIEDVVLTIFNSKHKEQQPAWSHFNDRTVWPGMWYATYDEPMAYRDWERYLAGKNVQWNKWFEPIIKAIEEDHANAFLSKSGWIRGLAKCIKERSNGACQAPH